MEGFMGVHNHWIYLQIDQVFVLREKAFILALWSLGFILFCDFAIDGGIPLCCEYARWTFYISSIFKCCIYESQIT
jgi:hypothetical protein